MVIDMFKAKVNEIPDKSSKDAALKRSVTREPISIFRMIKNAKDEEETNKLNQLLDTLRQKLPKGFKIGAAVGGADCFFDSVAQGLNELKDKGLITRSKRFSVSSLRKNCRKYAQQINQSKQSSWFSNVLKGEGEKLYEYIRRIELTVEDIENTSSGSKVKILKLENPIWGRPEIEGQIICEKYGVKVKIIELRDEEINGLYVTKGKVGTGNNTVYVVNYRSHFVPLLSNIEKNIKRSIKVSRDVAYGKVADLNSNNISQSYISEPSQNIENASYKQSDHSSSPGKKNRKTSRKRERSVTDEGNNAPKRVHMDANFTSNEDSKFPSDLQDELRQDELPNAYQTNRCIPHQLIRLMYQLDLSVLCLLRQSIYKHKYPSLSLAFRDSEIDKFSNVVLHYKEKIIHIQVENLDNYINSNINYFRLFNKERRSSSINSYFDSFVKYLIPKSDNLCNMEYLIVYTNSDLDLTEEKKLKQVRSKNFYPFKFYSINIEEYDFLKNFLFTRNNIQGYDFYQFSQDKATREELLKRLKFSPAVQKIIKKGELSQRFEKNIKEAFLDKLVFAVNQPNREELNSIIKSEMKNNSEFQDNYNYIKLQERMLNNLEKHDKLGSYKSGIIYEFNLLMFFLHDMFLHKNMFFINFEGKSHDITINYKGKITYLKAYNADNNIDYNQLFPSRQQNNTFSIDKLFTLFVEKLGEGIEYFIIYTNADLDLTEERKLKQGGSKDFYPLEFNSINIQKKKYKILRDCSHINENGLYQFAQEEITRKKVLNLLNLPSSLQKEEGRFSNKNEKEIKEKFLDKLIFAVNQPNRKELSNVLKNEIEKNNQSNKVPYNYEELHETSLRWLESHELGPITKGIMEKLLGDVKNSRSSYQEIQNKSIDEKVKFAKSVVSKKGTPAFNKFLDFLIKGEGSKYLEILRRKGINISSMSSILSRSGADSTKAFEDLYNLWFDKQGNKTQYLKTLEKEKINLSNMSSILSGTRANAANAFKDLYDLWFDAEGSKTQYLTTLEKEKINLSNMSSILSGARVEGAEAFKKLYDLWFDAEGNKTQYLKTLEKEKINLSNMSSILNKAGSNAPEAFKKLYDLWFDAEGNKTLYLKTLEQEGINLANISSILNGAGSNAAKAFESLYNLWFDKQGNKTQYLKTLEKEGMNLCNISSILSRVGSNAPEAFKDLYDLWFDAKGNKTQYLKTLEKEEINLSNVSNILNGAGVNAKKAFKDLYDLWFDAQGNKTQYLKTLEKNGVDLANISSILSGARVEAAETFKDLYSLWFDVEGNKTQYLKTLEKEEINLSNMSSILSRAGSNAPEAFKKLYDLWFDAEGNKTLYLKTLEKEEINLCNMSNILREVGKDAAKAFKKLYDLWFDTEGNKTQYLKTLEKEEINLSNMSSILSRAGSNAPEAFKKLYNLWFDAEGNKTQYLKTLETERINLSNMSSVLGGAGINAAKAFEDLYDLWFDEEGNKTQYLKTLEENGIDPANMSSILHGVGSNVTKAFKGLYHLWFDKKGRKTQYLKTPENHGINLTNISNILNGVGFNAAKTYKDLYGLWFDADGNKTPYLKTLEKEGIKLTSVSSILGGAGANAVTAFKDLYNLWFDEQGNKTRYLKTLEKEGIDLVSISSILHRTGTNAAKAFKDLYNTFFDERGNKKQHLKHFIEKNDDMTSFNMHSLSGILNGSGAKAKDAFEKLHNVCFNDDGKRTKLLDDFYKAGSGPSNLSSALCGSGVRASSILKKFHSVCFNEKREKTKLLDYFYDVGFSLNDLCDILSGAMDSLENFYDFCSTEEAKKYFSHFLKEGFTLSNLSRILHGARANICSVLKDFHDACFDETESTTQLLDDFHNAGFTPSDLSSVLTMAGNNASSILRNFHKSCFNKKNYLNHFLAEKTLFTPKNLSKILDRAGLNIYLTFKKLHDLCFDKVGNKTNYLNNLIKNNPLNEVLNILQEKVRKASVTEY